MKSPSKRKAKARPTLTKQVEDLRKEVRRQGRRLVDIDASMFVTREHAHTLCEHLERLLREKETLMKLISVQGELRR